MSICKHNRLERQCNECSLEEDVADLTARVKELEAVLENNKQDAMDCLTKMDETFTENGFDLAQGYLSDIESRSRLALGEQPTARFTEDKGEL